MVGLERSVLPLVGQDDFGLESSAAILAFVLTFGARRRSATSPPESSPSGSDASGCSSLGWVLVLPVAPLIALAPSWWYIVGANILLGASQGFAWSMTVVMKIDLAGPRRRGLALGLNEAAGYLGVALAAFASGALAASYAPRTVVWIGAAVVSTVGLLLSIFAVRDTGAHVAYEQSIRGDAAAPPAASARLPRREHPRPDVARLQPGRTRQQPERRARLGARAALPRCATARACARSPSSQPLIPSSGAPRNSAPAGFPTTSAASP